MQLRETIRQELVRLRQEDFPEWLAAEIAGLLEAPPADAAPLLQILAEQLQDYDAYAGAGCFGDSCGPAQIEATLAQLRAHRGGPSPSPDGPAAASVQSGRRTAAAAR